MKILLVEDSQDIADFVVNNILNGTTIEVKHAIDGDVAIAILKEETFDLVICDHHMPNATGEKVYHYLRNDIKKDSIFLHHSSAPCPQCYENSDQDDKFFMVDKLDINSIICFISL